jgi:outer membrane protein OmpA-like peptidoglycan-associated protein
MSCRSPPATAAVDRRASHSRGRAGSDQSTTVGVTDLMTSLAVIFVLLLVVFVNASRSTEDRSADHHPTATTPAEPPSPAPPVDPLDRVRQLLATSLPEGLSVDPDPSDPQVLRVALPESVLHFEFGKSALSPDADRFLADLMPRYATALCGALRDQVAGVVVEGHTDDLGDDALNLRLSQERSFRVLVRALDAIRAAAPEAHECFARLASASGRGKQDLIYDDQQHPDRGSSRRVALKVLLRSQGAVPGASGS